MKRAVLTVVVVLCMPWFAFATWSVIALDRSSGQVIIASATCVPQTRFPPLPSRDLMDVQLGPGPPLFPCQSAQMRSGVPEPADTLALSSTPGASANMKVSCRCELNSMVRLEKSPLT